MKAELIFFDNIYESANGTLRGLIGFISILILYYLLHNLNNKLFYFNYKIVITSLLISCCLGVIKPINIKTSLLSGALLGFVIFTLIGIYDSAINTSNMNLIIYILTGIIITSLVNLIVWKLYWTNNIRIRGSKTYYILWHLTNIILFVYFFYVIRYNAIF